MKKIFFVLMVAVLITACNQEEVIVPQTYSVTGYSQTQVKSRTYFYEDWITESPEGYEPLEDGLIFLWSEDDCIWVGNEKSTSTTIEEDESATFGGFTSNPAGQKVYYNMTGETATQAYVLAEQDVNRHLGLNGDFAYAEMTAHDDGNFFELEHATSYIWFDVLNLLEDENATLILNSITLDAGVNIAGKATWDVSSFGEISEGSSKIMLKVDKEIGSNETLFPMVVFPVDLTGRNVNVTYKFTLDGETKFYQQKLPGKELRAGYTQWVLPIYVDESGKPLLTDYELRVLTFEDEDVIFEPYTLDFAGVNIATWSDLIAQDQYGDYILGYGAWSNICVPTDDSHYYWYDKNNTFLAHDFPLNYDSYCFAGGGHAISNYASNNYSNHGDYTYQLTVYNKNVNGLVRQGGGHNGSNNFAMHYGYYDNSGWNQTTEDALPAIYFKDDKARIIDHLWVNLSTYEYYCLYEGNGLTAPLGEGDYVIIEAIGHKENGTTARISIRVADLQNGVIDDWTKWDLSSLGKVKKVHFNIIGTNDNGYGFSQPAYFAYDDVAVQFTE